MEVSFQGYNKKKKELVDYKKSVCKVIDQFIKNDEQFIKDHYNSPIRDFSNSFDFYKNIDNIFIVRFNYGGTRDYLKPYEVSFTPEEYNRLISFMKDPNLHININKFNL